MDRLDTSPLGGFPLDLNDLEWALGGIQDAFNGLTRFAGANYILTGCEFTHLGGFIYDATPGWAVIDGEVCKFAGLTSASLGYPDSALCLSLEVTDEPGASEVFEDLSNVNAYKRRRAIVTPIAFTPGAHVPIVGNTVRDKLQDLLAIGALSAWRILDEPGEPTLDNDYAMGTGVNRIMFAKDSQGVVRLKGRINCVGATAQVAFTLPAGYRPAGRAGCLLQKTNPTVSPSFQHAYIDQNGNFTFYFSGAIDASDVFELSGFPTYYADF